MSSMVDQSRKQLGRPRKDRQIKVNKLTVDIPEEVKNAAIKRAYRWPDWYVRDEVTAGLRLWGLLSEALRDMPPAELEKLLPEVIDAYLKQRSVTE